MDFMLDIIMNGVTGFFANLANNILNEAFKLLTHFLLGFSDINRYITVGDFLKFSQAIASALLVVAIVWEGFKYQSNGAFSSSVSISSLIMKTLFAGTAIFLLPYSVTKILIPLNENIILGINKIADDYTVKINSILEVFLKLKEQGIVLILGLLILGIAFMILAIVSAIRYIDLIICILIAPISAISIIGNGEGVVTWLKETISIIFTQSVHILLLQILLRIMLEEPNLTGILLTLGAIVVMIRGANVLKSYMYKSGTGAGIMSISSMAIMKSNVSMISPKTVSVGK